MTAIRTICADFQISAATPSTRANDNSFAVIVKWCALPLRSSSIEWCGAFGLEFLWSMRENRTVR